MLERTVTRSMLRPSSRPLALATCLRCQHRAFSSTYQRLAEPKATKSRFVGKPSAPPAANKPVSKPTNKAAKAPPENPQDAAATVPALQEANESAPAPPLVEHPLANAPRSYGKRIEKFTPTILPRPIGMENPPQPGENTGIDFRSVRQRRDDFVNWEKHLKRREEL